MLVIETPPRYFAKEMAKADELKMLRIMVSRSEVSSSNCPTNQIKLLTHRTDRDLRTQNMLFLIILVPRDRDPLGAEH